MIETTFKEGTEFNYIRHNEITPGRMTLLFLHGLGESGQCFQEAFDDAFHWLMIDKAREFYSFVYEYICN